LGDGSIFDRRCKDAGAAAIAHILQLNDDAVGIAEIELGSPLWLHRRQGRAFSRGASSPPFIRRAGVARCGGVAPRDAAIGQRFHDPIDVEASTVSEVIDRRAAFAAVALTARN